MIVLPQYGRPAEPCKMPAFKGVHVIGKSGLKKLIAKHLAIRTRINALVQDRQNITVDLPQRGSHRFASADKVGDVLIFKVLHNELRLITAAFFRS